MFGSALALPDGPTLDFADTTQEGFAVQTLDTAARFATLPEKQPLDEYNYEHFRTKHLLNDFRRTVTERGIQPGEMAPDFELPSVGGGSVRMSDLRGTPVLLHFGSYS